MNNTLKVMGILNVTPDSFSDGGKYTTLDCALRRTEQMIGEGADIIDIGGESTRPGSERVSLEEEMQRVIPVVEQIKANFAVDVSIDTYKAQVAEEALKRGADIINDISACSLDPSMAEMIARYNATCVIMHMQGDPKSMQTAPHYTDVVEEVKEYLAERIQYLTTCGVNKIIIDPGFGFGKSVEDNYRLLKHLNVLQELGHEILVGMSRKSMIGKLITTKPQERIAGTVTLHTIALLHGASIIRVHDVKEAKQSIIMLEKYLATE